MIFVWIRIQAESVFANIEDPDPYLTEQRS